MSETAHEAKGVSATERVRAAVERSFARRSTRLHYSADQTTPFGDPTWLRVGPGYADFANRRVYVAFDGAAFAEALGDEAAADAPQFRQQRAESLFAGDDLYFRAGTGEPWTRKQVRKRGAIAPMPDDPTWALQVAGACGTFRQVEQDGRGPSEYAATMARDECRIAHWPRYGVLEWRKAQQVEIHVWIGNETNTIARTSWAVVGIDPPGWHVTAFTDYGVPLPSVVELPSPPATART